eukprot:gene2703-5320_t
MTIKPRRAVIIGGGPVGLSAALMLKKRGWDEVNIIERRPVSSFEAQKAYVFSINPRGQKCTNLLNITDKMATVAVSSKTGLKELIEVLVSGKLVMTSTGIKYETYIMPRFSFVDMLLNEITSNTTNENIKLSFDTTCQSFLKESDGTITVTAKLNGDDKDIKINADLIIGCDGFKSQVRTWLDEISTAEGDNNRFKTVQLPSDSAGLRYKVLTIQDQFPLPKYPKTNIIRNNTSTTSSSTSNDASTPATANTNENKLNLSENEKFYIIRGLGKSVTSRIFLGLFPVKSNVRRTAIIVCRPDHDIWKQKSFSDVRTFFTQRFPQMSWKDNDRGDDGRSDGSFVSSEELRVFSETPPGMFPKPQYCNGMYKLFSTDTGVLLAGDSVH